ncbi:hypothetical protein BGZ83_008371 [Gryganskiella cystojenkinii]|nr:hypothetical protein BGZ83_008371 [Gryganskiella cystojenkinii]
MRRNFSTETASLDSDPRSSSDADADQPSSPDRSEPGSIPSSPLSSSSSKPEIPATTDPSSSSWQFPVQEHQSADRVRTWPSTNQSLARFYEALHRHRRSKLSSSLSSPLRGRDRDPGQEDIHDSSASLEQVMICYNYLSQLQETHDTILIPRRDIRTVFLLQASQPKTTSNLKQLLRIASDLISFHDKGKRLRKRSSSTSPSLVTSDKSNVKTFPETVYRTRADKFHGLRVSEYTVVMNWIGSTKQLAAVRESRSKYASALTLQDQDQNDAMVPSDGSGSSVPSIAGKDHERSQEGNIKTRDDAFQTESIKKAWSIWQDFSMTGMKPDVVLCTSLIDLLLKAGEVGRADQIWRYLEPTSSFKSQRRRDLDSVSKTLNDVAVASGSLLPSTVPTPSSTLLSGSTSVSGARIQPNLQTLSVMMQAHIRERDLDGVARIYREILQHEHHSSSIGANSALLNQILTVLLDLGETGAAKEIYSNSKADTLRQDDRSYTKKKENSLDSIMHIPIHQQGFHRRSTWRSSRRSTSVQEPQQQRLLPSSFLLRPDLSTIDLVLRHARLIQDRDWENEILNDLANLQGPALIDGKE